MFSNKIKYNEVLFWVNNNDLFLSRSVREDCAASGWNDWCVHHNDTETGGQERTDSYIPEASATWVQGQRERCCKVLKRFFFKKWVVKYRQRRRFHERHL